MSEHHPFYHARATGPPSPAAMANTRAIAGKPMHKSRPALGKKNGHLIVPYQSEKEYFREVVKPTLHAVTF
ncbi:hypothetical protein ACM911_000791 [Cronobacter dublinensis]